MAKEKVIKENVIKIEVLTKEENVQVKSEQIVYGQAETMQITDKILENDSNSNSKVDHYLIVYILYR